MGFQKALMFNLYGPRKARRTSGPLALVPMPVVSGRD